MRFEVPVLKLLKAQRDRAPSPSLDLHVITHEVLQQNYFQNKAKSKGFMIIMSSYFKFVTFNFLQFSHGQ